MPELPEVETIVRELRSKIVNEVFSEFIPVWPGSFVGDNKLLLEGNRIREISRKGKYILMKLDQGYMLIHLRMTGQLIVRQTASENEKHLRIIFRFKSGKYLLYFDLRKFGRIFHTTDPERILQNTGIDALSKNLDLDKFKEIVKNKSALVKPFMLNQKYIAGFGNIYVDESLFKAKIHPQSKLSDLSALKIKKLFIESRKVLLDAIARMGSTISDYKTTGGGFGSNQKYFQVYQRAGMPCFNCKTAIQKIFVGGRGTHFCPKCQKKLNN